MQKKEKNKKIFSLFVLFIFVLIEIMPFSGKAATLTIPDTLVDVLGSAPINSADNQLTGANNKTQNPTVTVFFDSSEINQPGGRMVATATPGYFNNASDPSKLYFTWYLKRKGCEKDDSVGDNNTCDLDGNNKINENDWKIAATRLIVSGFFDKTGVDYDKLQGIGSDDSGFVVTPGVDQKKGSLDIGWRNGFLRDSGGELYQENTESDDVANCYVQAPVSGQVYELRKTISDFTETCTEGYHRACVSNQTVNCDVFNVINADYQETFNACGVASERSDHADAFCKVEDDIALKNFKAVVACEDQNNLPLCVKNDSSSPALSSNMEYKNNSSATLGVLVGTKLGTSVGVDDTFNNKMCSAVAKQDTVNAGLFLTNTNPLFGQSAEKCDVLKAGLIAGDSTLKPICSFQKGANLCKHLFPVLPKSVKTDNGKQAVIGDGEFNVAEKAFWGADPTKVATLGLGKDEQRAVGLGVNTFQWVYTTGDEVGVAVEGESTEPTQHEDSAYQRTWAFSNGTCKVLDELEKNNTLTNQNSSENTRGFYIEGNYGILTAQLDLNDCLEENLLDPRDNEGSSSKLNVQLVSEPLNPVNDPDGRGDILTISTASMNVQDYENLLYKWTVQLSRDGSTMPTETTNWKDITTELVKNLSFSAVDIVGMGRDKLVINLNLSEALIENNITGSYDGTFYLKVKTKITATAIDGNQNTDGYLIVKVRAQQNELLRYPVIANSAGMLSMDDAKNSEMCSGAVDKTRCFVTKNEIIGVEVPNADNKLTNFTWKINGNEANCDSGVSSQCVSGGNKLFFPVLGNIGEAVDIVATALNNKTNETIEVSRHFVITGTEIMISSGDTNTVWPKLLGYYKDLNGNRYPDYSDLVYETQEGSIARVVAGFSGSSEIAWIIDGQERYEWANQREITFPIDKMEGLSYNVNLTASYKAGSEVEINNLRKALLKNWNIAPEESIVEEMQEANIQINVLAPAQVSANKNIQGGFASLITHLPENLIFLFRLILTAGGLLLLTGIVFAVMPETLFEKEKN